ncbi:hypothetical protein [Komarekiella delphini-convector]|uniref:hypothetical protein n=1 Tax=Komarekiella delphini-convector TaxID=3050158 RepID=UPI001CD84B32|nr:hypothetical protein [Komarekiella delphini-convector]
MNNAHDIVPTHLAVQAMRDNGYKNAAYAMPSASFAVVNGDLNNRLSGNLHISIPDIPNSAIIARVRHQLAISTGAACSSGVVAPSHVLQAMNLSNNVIEGALRIGIGKFTTKEEIEKASFLITNAVNEIHQLL